LGDTIARIMGVDVNEVPESHRGVLDAPFATLATIGPTGRPQLSTVCFVVDGDAVLLSLNETRQKTINILADPRVSVHVTDPSDPGRYVELRGTATVEPDDDYEFADRLGTKYGGLDLRRMDAPGEHRLKIVVAVDRARAVDMSQPGTVGSARDR
jgi:PPOX class probable F420-dependent enzyme